MPDLPAGPTFPIPDVPPPAAAAPPPPAPPPWSPGGWNDPRGMYDRDGKRPLRWGPIVVFGVLFLGLAGVLLALFLIPKSPPRPAVVAVAIWKYTDPALPPNPFARKDGERLEACFPADTKRPEAPAGRQEVIETADALRTFTADLAKQKDDRPFVCSITALADETPAGAALLAPVPGGGDVTVKDLLDGMKACPAKEKLLILDLARPLARPVTGPFKADPARAVHDAITAYGNLPCPVIVSCSPGEVSVPMDPEGNSAFGFYLAEGLRGAADGSDDKKPERDRRVTVRELYLFTVFRTNRWAAQVRGVTQTPRLYAKGVEAVNFDVFIPEAFPVRTYEVAANPMPAALADGWAARDSRRVERVRNHPLALAATEGILLRAEAYWRAGDAERARRELDQPQALKWAGGVVSARESWRYPTLTAVEAVPPPADKKEEAARAEEATALRKAVDEYWRKLQLTPPKPDEAAGAREVLKGMAAGSPGPVVRAVWAKLLTESAPSVVMVKDVSALVEAVTIGKPTAERALLYRLANLPEEQRIDPKAVAALLAAEDAAGRAIAAAVDDVFPAVADRLKAADESKRQAEAVLFKPEPSAKEKDDAIAALKRAAAMFVEAADRAGAVREAAQEVRDALWLLSATAPAAGEDDGWYRDWKALADTLAEPVGKVFAVPLPPDSPDDWRTAAGRVRVSAARLRKRVTDARALAAKLEKEEAPAVADVAALRTVLLTSAPSAKDRAALWAAVDKAEGVLHKKVREDLDEKENASPKGMPHAEPAMADPPDLETAARRRGEVSIALGRLAGIETGKLTATGVRTAWGESVISGRIAGWVAAVENWPTAERLTRSTAPPAAGLYRPEKFPGPAPAERTGKAAQSAADGWLEQHFRAYQLLRPGTGDFYPTQAGQAAVRVRQSAE